jgi:hypothetical protein
MPRHTCIKNGGMCIKTNKVHQHQHIIVDNMHHIKQRAVNDQNNSQSTIRSTRNQQSDQRAVNDQINSQSTIRSTRSQRSD